MEGTVLGFPYLFLVFVLFLICHLHTFEDGSVYVTTRQLGGFQRIHPNRVHN